MPLKPSAAASASLIATKLLNVPALGGVVLMSRQDGHYWFCNGVALTTRRVLTAAHCCPGRTYLVSSPELDTGWVDKGETPKLRHDSQEIASCEKAPTILLAESRALEHRSADLAIVTLSKPLPLHVLPVQRLARDFVVKKAPILDLEGMSRNRLLQIAASPAEAVVSQYVPPGRFAGTSVAPMLAKVRFLGFDVAHGIAVLEGITNDLMMSGTSGSGVFVETSPGDFRLIAIASGILEDGFNQAIMAVDVRPYAAWIDAEIGKP